MSKKILIVTYGGGHSKLALPVIKELINNNYEVVIFSLTTSMVDYEGLDVKFYGYKDFFTDRLTIKYGRMLAETLTNIINYEETISYLGRNFKDLVDELGLDHAQDLYNKSGRQIFNPIKSMLEVLNAINPDLVIITDSPRSERAAGKASILSNIPVLMIVGLFPMRGMSWIVSESYANKVCVFSEEVKSILVRNGRNSQDVVVTGNPTFDSLIHYKNSLKKRKEINKSKFKILWASQIEPEYCFDIDKSGDPNLPVFIEEHLIKVCLQHKDWELIIRHHPNEVFRACPSEVHISNANEPIINILKYVDCIVTTASAVGLQGSIMGKQLITIDSSILTSYTPYSDMGISTGVKDILTLESVLILASKGELKNEFSYDINNATTNIVFEIQKLLKDT